MFLPLLLVAGVAFFLFEKKKSATPIASDTAGTTKLGPRGETVFTSNVAQGLLRTLGNATFAPPDPTDPTLIRLDVAQAPISEPLSAAGWVEGINATHSVAALQVLTNGDAPSPLPSAPPAFLRAVAAGNESQLPSGYAVLLYAGALAKQELPPGTPAQVPLPDILPPVTLLASALAEVGAPFAAELTTLLTVMASPAQLEQLASALSQMGKSAAAVLVHQRAQDLATLQVPSGGSPGIGVPALPPAVTHQDPLNLVATPRESTQPGVSF